MKKTEVSKLKKLYDTPLNEWKDSDFEFIDKLSKAELGGRKAGNCMQCWKDQVILLLKADAEKQVAENLLTLKREKFLRPNLNVLFNGQHINAATIDTDAKVDALLAAGFPEKFIYTKKEIAEAYNIDLGAEVEPEPEAKENESNQENQLA